MSLLESLLVLSSEKKVCDLFGGGSGLNNVIRLCLRHDFRKDLLSLFTSSNSGVGVVKKSNELVLFRKMRVVGLDCYVRSHAESECDNESNEASSGRKVLFVLLGRKNREKGFRPLNSLIALELVRFLGQHSHSNVVGTTH